jgi:squalene-associated FAD-dependent desaturase
METLRADDVVIGAGFAGLSAAVRLADAGRRVIVVEEAPRLGGRATAFVDRESGERVDNGQHVLFGCYRETYAFLERLGTTHLAPLQPNLSVAMADGSGRHGKLRCPPWRPPWHLMAGVLTWRALPLADRLSAIRLAPLLRQVRRDGPAAVAARVAASDTVSSWLPSHGQSRRLCEWLWHPLAVAALNQDPAAAAAAPFVRVLGELFGPRREDAAIGLASVPLDELYAEPARRFLEARGGAVLTRSAARVRLGSAGKVSHVEAGSALIETTSVVAAMPWHAFGRIWERDVPPALADTASRAAAMESSPIVTVNLWFDGAVMREPFVGLVGGPMHWVFDKSTIFGAAAGHLSIVSSGAAAIARLENAELTSLAHRQLTDAMPEARARQLLRSVVVREHRATFSLSPGAPARPATRTAVGGLFLAGDWTDTGLPATIEGAVLSGHRAARAILDVKA